MPSSDRAGAGTELGNELTKARIVGCEVGLVRMLIIKPTQSCLFRLCYYASCTTDSYVDFTSLNLLVRCCDVLDALAH